MSYPKSIIVKESLQELKSLLKRAKQIFVPRIRMLIEIKKDSSPGISKRQLADLVGVNHNSIQNWRLQYEKGGINLLCSHKLEGFKPSVINRQEHKAIEEKLNNPVNELQGYKELLAWFEQEFSKQIKYNTLLKYCNRNFKSKVKVARKSHINKDEKAVETFKKTSVKSVQKR
ncbi:MAG: hypothetical protein K8R31_03175 [Bacteroidales bacterium]|nr:hypothetical protein [Bacteroidales bacterium]